VGREFESLQSHHHIMDVTIHIPEWFFNHPYIVGWYLSGILLSFVWPIKYRDGMAGHWWSFYKGTAFLWSLRTAGTDRNLPHVSHHGIRTTH
jgi:hypothetical protein